MELARYFKGILQRGVGPSIRTLYYTGELKYGNVIGKDVFGNSYFENLNEPHGRHRWVEYADPAKPEATTVPPEWFSRDRLDDSRLHSWLHHISDKHGNSQDMISFTPQYKRDHLSNPTGTDGAYTPPNYLYNIEKAKDAYEEQVAAQKKN
ncbi:NADH dehydrogenase ubiquinone 1 alpha subcomplex subunit 12 [Heterostelium album PN500]|uniref:NADH dehydrogenase [ubiquinone] 1 alpha subcomplex subunit 12 n=1 Tax=Heterostelium pallidum (strain ATCC 26659 / Pp 5 / PN500) TaxID=670386 RepID=D3BHQ4_HETP5|nr:NADH dehydrogenase ubiquinone 1 alpha subcomplex subunit 12 [Heterostelium album PN500]EFA78804.1 NADH dehydrogenase ubiquinone 1 alpha subcomplex subunit 12 [Heterostelium album PN500]|eukprot:XP_020430928.1 NADH dehydrogenase ubiquinone 1 alpha subcomplex subunit 12 [Heterostelium album PN500]